MRWEKNYSAVIGHAETYKAIDNADQSCAHHMHNQFTLISQLNT